MTKCLYEELGEEMRYPRRREYKSNYAYNLDLRKWRVWRVLKAQELKARLG